MAQRIIASQLQVDEVIYDLVNHEILPGTGITSEDFWDKFAVIINDFAPKNRYLLSIRHELQLKMVWSPLLQHDPGHRWMRQLIKTVSEEIHS